MGAGSYSMKSRKLRSQSKGYQTKTAEQIFTSRGLDPEMDPNGVTLRESRDSDEHPLSVPIILGLDVTASMGRVPHMMIKNGLPKLMSTIIEHGEPDPQLLFMGIGDHLVDSAPLQIGQFESSDELLDYWLEKVWLEGGGGGNGGESYMLAWMFAAHFTKHDAMEKRGEKGFLFTVGDEPLHSRIDSRYLKDIMGNPVSEGAVDSTTFLKKAQELYHVYHFCITETHVYKTNELLEGWRQTLGNNVIAIEDHNQVPVEMAKIITAQSDRAKKVESAKDVVDVKVPEAEETNEQVDEESDILDI